MSTPIAGTAESNNASTNVLPALSDDYSLAPDQIGHYRENGHLLLRGVASAEEVAAYRPVINSAAQAFNTEHRPLAERDTYGKAFLQIMNLWTRDEGVKRFTTARRFAKIAADLMGVEAVRIYHDQALFKEPGGGATPFHQDQHYWPLDTDDMITMWMPLVPVTEEVGSMTFASGSHRLGYLGDLPISDASEEALRALIEERGLTTHTYGAMRPGDATWHAGWMLHGAPGNPTQTLREVMTVIYYRADARVVEPDSKSRRDDLERWLPGLKPGDVAASELNPLVYQK